MTDPDPTRRPYCVGAVKIPYADRDVFNAVLTEEDDRGFYDIIGADTDDDDDAFPLGAHVTYRVELTDAEADEFREASNCRYVEPDVALTADWLAGGFGIARFGHSRFGNGAAGNTEIPSATTMQYMRASFPRSDVWHGQDVPVAILDGGTTAAVRDYMGWTLLARDVFGTEAPGVDEYTNEHGCFTATNGVPVGGLLIDAVISDSSNTTSAAAAAAAMRYAADNGAQVVNLSFSGPTPSTTYTDAIAYLQAREIQLYCSAGNDNLASLNYPAAYSSSYSNVHSSIAFDENTDARASFSNHAATGSGCAPGVSVLTLNTDATVTTWSGTSASSPHMAQLCARVATGGRFSTAQAATALDANTRNTGQVASEQGHGAYTLTGALTALNAFQPGEQRTNLSPNPSCDSNATGWAGGTSPTRVTGLTGFGRTTGFSAAAAITTPAAPSAAGGPHYQALFVRCTSAATLSATISWYTTALVLLSTTTPITYTAAAGGIQRVAVGATAPPSAASATMTVTTTAGTLTATQHLAETATYLGGWFDGATDHSIWTGTTGNSSSTRTFPVPVAAIRRNRCTNPSLETVGTGYATTAARSGVTVTTVGRASTIVTPVGTTYGFVNITGNNTTDAVVPDAVIALPELEVTAGQKWTFSNHTRRQGLGATQQWQIRWDNAGGTEITTVTGNKDTLHTTAWVRYRYTATAPAGAVKAKPSLRTFAPADTLVRAWRFDGFMYEQGSSLGDYFDGATSGGGWENDPQQSASTFGPFDETGGFGVIDYSPPVEQVFPLVDLPSTSTPVTAAWLNHVNAVLADLATAVAGRVPALESAVGYSDEKAQDAVAAAIAAGTHTGLTWAYDDSAGSLSSSVTSPIATAFGPADHGRVTWTVEPTTASLLATPTVGLVYMLKMKLPSAATISALTVGVQTAGTTLTDCYVALFNSSGTRVALSADQSTAWQSTGIQDVALTTPYAAAAGTYYGSFLIGGSATTPVFFRGGNTALINVGLTAPGLRFGFSGSAQTAIPSTVSLSGVTATLNSYFMAMKV